MVLPENFRERTRQVLNDEYPAFEAALDTISPTSIRINTKIANLSTDEKVSWCDSGCYLQERPLFTADPLLHGGAYYVQEASSMFLYQVVKQCFANSERVLDLCAAPGGKSTLLSQTLPADSLLVSNEIVRQRAQILAENITKWGNANVVVTNNKASDFALLEHYFDAIVIDAPCSGEGMFRKDSNAINEWSVENVMNCVSRQREILNDVWDALKPNGILVYSTCTYNREENEENVAWICKELGAEGVKLNIDNSNIVETDGGYRFYPHRVRGEGFFISVMRKNDENSHKQTYKNLLPKNAIKFESPALPIQLMEQENFLFYNIDNKISAFNKKYINELMYIRSKFNCFMLGIELFEVKGKDLIPAHQLALSKLLDSDSCQSVEVDYVTAIAYLKREAVSLPDAPKGFLLIRYKSLALGWVKNIGNRCNNLYPQHWRIRMNL